MSKVACAARRGVIPIAESNADSGRVVVLMMSMAREGCSDKRKIQCLKGSFKAHIVVCACSAEIQCAAPRRTQRYIVTRTARDAGRGCVGVAIDGASSTFILNRVARAAWRGVIPFAKSYTEGGGVIVLITSMA